eukprot:754850-Hanusia_phi.AAC.1
MRPEEEEEEEQEQEQEHAVDLGEDADSPAAGGVDGLGELDGLGGGDVGVGGGDGEDDGVGVGDVLEDKVSDLKLDVLRLRTEREQQHRRCRWKEISARGTGA